MKTTFTPIAALLLLFIFSFSSCSKEDTDNLILTELSAVDSVSVYVKTGKENLTPPVQVIDFGNSVIQKHKNSLEYVNLDKITYSVSDFNSSAKKVMVRGELYFALAGSNIDKFLKIGTVTETDLKQVAAYPDVAQTIQIEGLNLETLVGYIKEGKKVSFMIYGYGVEGFETQGFEANFNLKVKTLFTVHGKG